jgi:cytochrome c biogenesis protein CcmG/thiol:disulfide interchange protein DsbE
VARATLAQGGRTWPTAKGKQALKRWLGWAPLGVLGALAVLFATFGLHHDPHFIPDALVGKTAPPETLPALRTGAPTVLKPDPDGPTLVNFFASWCGPCWQDTPALLSLQAEGVKIIGVAYKDDPANTKAFLARLGDPFTTVLVDRSGRVAIDYGVDAAPDTFLIAADGRVLVKHAGPLTVADATTLLAQIDKARRLQAKMSQIPVSRDGTPKQH